MKSITSHSSLRPFGWCVVLLALGSVLSGCAPMQRAPQFTDYVLTQKNREIASTPSRSRTYVPITEARQKLTQIYNKIRPTAERACLANDERWKSFCSAWTFSVEDSDDYAAFASGPQYIELSKGVFEFAESESEIAFVLAHEMGHHILNHRAEDTVNAIASVIMTAVILSAFGLDCDDGSCDDTLWEAANDGTLKYSVDQESEADRLAVEIISNSGYNIRDARGALIHIAKLAGSELRSSAQDTHPSGPERLAAFDLYTNSLATVNRSSSSPPIPVTANSTSARTTNKTVVGCVTGNCVNGQGTYTYANGNRYVGEFRDNKYHGKGTFTSANGKQYVNRYVGEFRDNKYHGKGTFTSSSGNQYVGEYRDNKYHGKGTFSWPSGDQYVGEFRDSKYHGKGTFTSANGNQYVGEFRDGLVHGQGTLTHADGRVEAGIWEGQVTSPSTSTVWSVKLR